jgi:hypothetical protein
VLPQQEWLIAQTYDVLDVDTRTSVLNQELHDVELAKLGSQVKRRPFIIQEL